MNLMGFMGSPFKNHWIREKGLHLDCYVRKSSRCLVRHEPLEPCLDIASIEVDAAYRGKGFFTKFLVRAEEVAHLEQRAVYIENVQHPWLVQALKARGYQETPTSVPALPTLWKKPFPSSDADRKGVELPAEGTR